MTSMTPTLLLSTFKTWRGRQWSQSYLPCVHWEWLRRDDVHYWSSSDREGLQSRALVLGLFGCPIPFYLFDYLQYKAPFNQTGNKCFLMWLWAPKLQQQDRVTYCRSHYCRPDQMNSTTQPIIWYDVGSILGWGGKVTSWKTKGRRENDKYFPNNSMPIHWRSPPPHAC